MGTDLFRFVFNTLQQRMNDPNNARLWLPKVLQGISNSAGTGTLLPLHEKNWPLGKVTGGGGDSVTVQFINFFSVQFRRWSNQEGQFSPPVVAKDFSVVATPGDKDAVLTLPEVDVFGLENATVEPGLEVTEHGNGYRCTITITFGKYQNTSLPKAIRLSGRFELRQSLSIADAGKTEPTQVEETTSPFTWPTFTLVGTGTFALDIEKIHATVDAEIDVDQDVRVTVTKITVAGTDGAPQIDIDEDALTIDQMAGGGAVSGSWKTIALEALEDGAGQAELIRGLNDALNRTQNLGQLGDTLTKNLRSQLDRTLGPGGGAAKSVDDNLFDRLRHAVNDEHSDYYLPAALLGITAPTLDPYDAGSLDPFDIDIMDSKGQALLSDTVINGIANALAKPDDIAFVPGITVKTTLSALPDGTKVTVNGSTHELTNPITLHATLAVKLNNDLLQDPGYWIKVAVTGATADFTLGTSGGAAHRVDTMAIALESATFAAADISIEINFDSDFDKLINEALAKRKDDLRGKIVKVINDRINGDRDNIGKSITTRARDLIEAKLDS
jgi:hypothetical protein